MRLASVSVDLDEIPNYYAIHGLPFGGASATLVYDVALPRLTRWAEAHAMPLTLFAIGRDLERAEARQALVRAHIDALTARAAERGVDYRLLDTSKPLDFALYDYLSFRERTTRVR